MGQLVTPAVTRHARISTHPHASLTGGISDAVAEALIKLFSLDLVCHGRLPL
jgi:hypothetical protein